MCPKNHFFARAFFVLLVFCFSVCGAKGQLPGQLDLSFNPGDVNLEAGTGFNSAVHAIAVQPDGKVLVGGNFTSYNSLPVNRFVRLNTNGLPDTSFTTGTGVNGIVEVIKIQSDGKILVAGSFTTYNGVACKNIARLNADGTLDSGFNTGTGPSFGTYATKIISLLLQPDGKIIAAGFFTNFNGISRNRITRLNTDGSLDMSFNPGSGANGLVNAAALQADGKIVIGGGFSAYDNVGAGASIARINTDGSADLTFDAGYGFDLPVYALAIQADGKIIAGGNFDELNGQPQQKIARLNTDGTPDTGFNVGAGLTSYMLSTTAIVRTLFLQPDGKIIAGGSFSHYNGTVRQNIVRINTDGSIDSAFNPDPGTNFGYTPAVEVYSICGQPDGKLLAGGNFIEYNNIARVGLIRAHANGKIDHSFNPETGANSSLLEIVPQPDGKVILLGVFTVYNGFGHSGIVRIFPNGAVDTTFNPGSGSSTGSVSSGVHNAALQSNGKIIIAGGFTHFNDTLQNSIARLNANGTIDVSFTSGTGVDGNITALAIQPDGKIIIGGSFTTYNGTAINNIARLNYDGSQDASFNPGTGSNSYIRSVMVQSDGKIIIAGEFTTFNGVSYNRIARLNSDGTLDSGFTPGAGANDKIRDLALLPDNKIMIAGDFTGYNGVARKNIARLNINGTLDASFDPGVGPAFYNPTLTSIIFGISVLANGQMMIAGQFDTYAGITGRVIRRINADGSLDTSFDVGAGASGLARAVAVLQDESVLVGGSFTNFNGVIRTHVAKLHGGNSAIITGTISSSGFCQGEVISVPFTTSGNFGTANIFTAQLSDSSGSFANPVDVGILSGTTSDTITATIPATAIPATGYRIRVVGSNPAQAGSSNATDLTIVQVPVMSVTAAQPTICLGTSTTLTASGAGDFYWSGAANLSPTYGAIVTALPSATGTYTYTITGYNFTCVSDTTVTLEVVTLPSFSATAAPDSLAPGDLLTLFISNPDTSLTYTWSGPDLNQTTGDTVTANPLASGTITYTVTASNGVCSETATVSVEVDPAFLIQTSGWDWVNTGGSGLGISQSGNNGSPEMLITGGETGIDIGAHYSGETITLGRFKGTATFGSTTLTASGDEDIVVMGSSAAGAILWATRAGSADMEQAKALAMDGAGNGHITGSFAGTASFGNFNVTSTGSEDAFIAKYIGISGGVSWVKRAGGTGITLATDIATDAQGNSTVVGLFSGTTNFDANSLNSNGNTDIFVARYDASANAVWAKNYGSTGEDGAYSIAIDNQGNTYITGTFTGTINFGSITLTSLSNRSKFMAKLDDAGNVLWAKITETASAADDADKVATNNSQLYTTGSFTGTADFGTTTLTSIGNTDIFIAAFFLDGTPIWAKRAGGAGDDIATGITTDTEGLCYITGSYNAGTGFGSHRLGSLGGEDVFVAKYDMAGNALWARKAGGIGNDAGMAIAVDDQGNSYTTGYFSGRATFGNEELFSNGAQDMFVAKLGHIAAVGVEEDFVAKSNINVYPNPFSSNFTINFTSASPSTEIILTDVLGRQIFSKAYQTQTGETTLQMQPENQLSQGLYLLQIKQDNQTQTIRIIKQ